MTSHFVLTRQSYRNDIAEYGNSAESSRAELEAMHGGQLEWFWSVPGLFHALAAPSTGQTVAAAPEAADPPEQSLGYWTALHYLLLYRLGWAKPDQGLRWWYEQGKPVDDPTLALVAAVWGADRRLDQYLAWLLQGQPIFLNPEHLNSADWASEAPEMPEKWHRWAAKANRDSAQGSTLLSFQGGWDPLHLTGHTGQSGTPDPEASLTVVSRSECRAIFLTSTMDAWYFDLAERAKSLPDIGCHSWRVDVVVKPVGFLGTYRKSRDTGLWFVGKHRYHTPGNP